MSLHCMARHQVAIVFGSCDYATRPKLNPEHEKLIRDYAQNHVH